MHVCDLCSSSFLEMGCGRGRILKVVNIVVSWSETFGIQSDSVQFLF